MSKRLGNHLCAKTGKIARALRQQLDALLPTVLESEIQAWLGVARADSITSLEGKLAQIIEKVVPKIINPLLSDLKVSIEDKEPGQFRSRVDSQLPHKKVLVNTVQV